LAVARAALREPDLPAARLDEPTRELKLLLDHREDLVAERTRVQNRLRWHVHELDPQLQVPAGPWTRPSGWIGSAGGWASTWTTSRVRRQAPQLLTLAGCGPLCAAKLLVETADVRRCKSEAAFAMHAGVAPSRPPQASGSGID
jgi:transposase